MRNNTRKGHFSNPLLILCVRWNGNGMRELNEGIGKRNPCLSSTKEFHIHVQEVMASVVVLRELIEDST